MCELGSTFHTFKTQPANEDLPQRFTCPFHYTPHPLSIVACKEVQAYLKGRIDWHDELQQGKMFGVLIVKNGDEYGYIAAYSGIIDGKNDHKYFVPPVFNLLEPQGHFKTKEQEISEINHTITSLLESDKISILNQELEELTNQKEKALSEHKFVMSQAKIKRDIIRQGNDLTEDVKASLIKESQYHKAEHKRIEKYWDGQLDIIRAKLHEFNERIEQLKSKRKKLSIDLQRWLFQQYKLRNANGNVKNIMEIFTESGRSLPPAGTGECAAPKLLQYAYTHGLRPLAMAEFWWGDSPKNEIRRHGAFYPSCKSKCEPILNFMLQGLNVEPNPQEVRKNMHNEPEILYEDEWLMAVNKPCGMLSVPGKDDAPSVFDWAKRHCPNSDGPLLVHRLDMDTSGILIIAKDKQTHKFLQEQFEKHEIKKKYVAIVKGTVNEGRGVINLPLCLNPDDRPKQMVSREYGKPAVTRYEVISHDGLQTRLALYPITGRTHQLRVHCAHQEGLNTPIIGDNLYGTPSCRLHLHAERIELRHPETNRLLRIESPSPF